MNFTQILDTSAYRRTVKVLSSAGQDALATQVGELIELAAEDPGDSPINATSLHHAAAFLIAQSGWPEPLLSVDPVGRIWVEWGIGKEGIMGLSFETSGVIRYTVVPSLHAPCDENTGRPVDILPALNDGDSYCA